MVNSELGHSSSDISDIGWTAQVPRARDGGSGATSGPCGVLPHLCSKATLDTPTAAGYSTIIIVADGTSLAVELAVRDEAVWIEIIRGLGCRIGLVAHVCDG